MYLENGYKTITVAQLVNIFYVTASRKTEGFFAFRVLCAWLALRAKQDATERTLRGQKQFVKKFEGVRKADIKRLVKSRKSIKAAFALLEEAGVIEKSIGGRFQLTTELVSGSEALLEVLCGKKRSATRPVPIPRAWLEHWAAPSRRRVTELLHFLYTSVLAFESSKGGAVKTKGAFKFSRLASAAPISERSMWFARSILIEEERISPDATYVQAVLNRRGHYVDVSLKWRANDHDINDCSSEREVDTESQQSVLQPHQEKTPPAAVPYRDKKHFVSRDQKRSGVSTKPVPGSPNINNIRTEDLYDAARLAALVRQQVWCENTLANFQNFVASAVRARRVGATKARTSDPIRIFVGLVRSRLWHHITDADEGEALRLIGEYRNRELRCDAGRKRSFEQTISKKTEKALFQSGGSLSRREIAQIIDSSLRSAA